MSEIQTSRPARLTHNERVQLNHTLIDVWVAAEERGDEAAVRQIQQALDILGLPWVRLRPSVFAPSGSSGTNE